MICTYYLKVYAVNLSHSGFFKIYICHLLFFKRIKKDNIFC
jgi:hypothetical protein